jgi:hypothetical protein
MTTKSEEPDPSSSFSEYTQQEPEESPTVEAPAVQIAPETLPAAEARTSEAPADGPEPAAVIPPGSARPMSREVLDEATEMDLAVKLMILWGFSAQGARAEIAQEARQFADTRPEVVLGWMVYLAGRAEKMDPVPGSGYMHCGLQKIHGKGGLRLPPSPEQQKRRQRAKEALHQLAEKGWKLRPEGDLLRPVHLDPRNAPSSDIPGWLAKDLRKYKPEIRELVLARERQEVRRGRSDP